jgi:hypothetical protein
LLVPRSSSTSVAVWTWPTLVVSRRRVLEAVFVLLEFPSPSRRIFIGSHSLPPLVRRFGPSIAKIFIYHIVMGGREEYEWIHKVSFAIHTMLAMVVRCMILLLRRVTFDYVCLMLYLDFLRYTIRPVRSVEKDTYVIEKDLYVRIRPL